MRLTRKRFISGFLGSMLVIGLSIGGLFLFNEQSSFANGVLYKAGLAEKNFDSTEKLFGIPAQEHFALRQREMDCAATSLEKAGSSNVDLVGEYYKCSYGVDITKTAKE